MRILALSTLAPSKSPLSSFGFAAIQEFLKDPSVYVTVIADTIDGEDIYSHERLEIKRQWQPNSLSKLLPVVSTLIRSDHDIIWINLQYTLFGPNYVPAFIGLLFPLILKLLNKKVIITLHNYLAVIELEKLGLKLSMIQLWLIRAIDKLIMFSITRSDEIILLSKEYYQDLQKRYPNINVKLVEHDLYPVPHFSPLPKASLRVLTLGNFGTYKKLDLYFQAYFHVQNSFRNVQFIVAGRDHPLTPNYVDETFKKYQSQDHHVILVGYINDAQFREVFQECNIVVLTNHVTTGSSSVIAHAARFGRPVIAPSLPEYSRLVEDGWGICLYKPASDTDLAQKIAHLLGNNLEQKRLAYCNYTKALCWRGDFRKGHLASFYKASNRIDFES